MFFFDITLYLKNINPHLMNFLLHVSINIIFSWYFYWLTFPNILNVIFPFFFFIILKISFYNSENIRQGSSFFFITSRANFIKLNRGMKFQINGQSRENAGIKRDELLIKFHARGSWQFISVNFWYLPCIFLFLIINNQPRAGRKLNEFQLNRLIVRSR